MLTPPSGFDEQELLTALRAGWGLGATAVRYLAVGFGSHHWEATTDAGPWFVTVDDLMARRNEPTEALVAMRHRIVTALDAASRLRAAGIGEVVAPVPTLDGDATRTIDERYLVAVYPMIGGRTHEFGAYTDDRHRAAVVRVLARVHHSPADCRHGMLTDTFAIARRAEFIGLHARLDDVWDTGPYAEPTRQRLVTLRDDLERAFARYDRLASHTGAHPERFVLTHGEPHPGNTITTADGVKVIDWDTALLAPPERDLWSLVTEDPTVAERYRSLTGVRLDEAAIELYRLAWPLTDITTYGTALAAPHTDTADTAAMWRNLCSTLDRSEWQQG